MNSRLEYGVNQLNLLKNEYTNIVNDVSNYAKSNGYIFDKEIAFVAYQILLGATILREESKWDTTTQLLNFALEELNMLGIINEYLKCHRTINDYVNNTAKLSYDLDKLYSEITKQALYTFFYILTIYSKIKHSGRNPFGRIDEILCALNYAVRNKDDAKTFTKNYISTISDIVNIFPLDRYSISNYFNWIQSGFICDYDIYNGK